MHILCFRLEGQALSSVNPCLLPRVTFMTSSGYTSQQSRGKGKERGKGPCDEHLHSQPLIALGISCLLTAEGHWGSSVLTPQDYLRTNRGREDGLISTQ